jgi:hypothetical protein
MRGGGNSTSITWRTQDGVSNNENNKRHNKNIGELFNKAPFDKKDDQMTPLS